MEDALDHGKAVLSAILPRNGDKGRKDLLEIALKRLVLDHFLDPQQRVIFQMLDQYLGATGLVLPRSAVGDMLRSQPPGTALQYESYYDLLLSTPPGTDDFAWRVDQLRDLAAERRTGERLAQSMEILQRGAHHDKEFLQGHVAARSWAMEGFADIDRELHLQDAPEGDVRDEAADIIEDYTRRVRNQRSGYGIVQTAIPQLNEDMGGGIQPGELVLIAADTGTGKSSMAADWGWHTCVMQGKNVVVFTSETNRVQYRYKIVARHSRYLADRIRETQNASLAPLIERFPAGLDTRLIRAGRLGAEGAEFLERTVKHFAGKQQHGRCYIAQVGAGATIGTITSRLARISRMFPADLVIIDYLALLRSDRRRQSKREELSDIVISAQELARTYMDGRGVPIVSPWQMNREGSKAAQTRGYYVTSDLAETAEASSAADAILGLLARGIDDTAGRRAPIELGEVKIRDGVRRREAILLEVDYATACYSPRDANGLAASPEALASALGGGLGSAPA